MAEKKEKDTSEMSTEEFLKSMQELTKEKPKEKKSWWPFSEKPKDTTTNAPPQKEETLPDIIKQRKKALKEAAGG